MNKCTDFAAAAVEPLTEVQIIYITYGLVSKMRHYMEYCRVFRDIKDTNKILNTFQDHFI